MKTLYPVLEGNQPGSRGGGGGHLNVTGVLVGFFERTSKRYRDLVLLRWPQVAFTPKRYQNKTSLDMFIICIRY